jgi:hypothetical protein
MADFWSVFHGGDNVNHTFGKSGAASKLDDGIGSKWCFWWRFDNNRTAGGERCSYFPVQISDLDSKRGIGLKLDAPVIYLVIMAAGKFQL